ncbi:N-acetylmuramic acid 6-phosphate etherase [Sulfobacillus thermotolerans]|uniref:N-acetylmuramic acid 6-phosphate etherase n=1 Tax=Sulfobacillus thermotolerans TaxID=338644 RepID=A0ABM6RV95_9FIRM|nr:N-acetylmuramic acid 6-phosphate etherase [Sulfobacillus thermotolerans]
MNMQNLSTEISSPDVHILDSLSSLDLLMLLNQQDQTVAIQVSKILPSVACAVEKISQNMAAGGRLIYVGAGTSGRLGVLDAAECPPTFGVDYQTVIAVIAGGDKAIRQAVEKAEDDMDQGARELELLGIGPLDSVIGISASGRTPYVLGALQYAAFQKALTVSVSNNVNSEIGRASTVVIEVETGPEVLAGSTRLKAGTAQKMVLNMISTAVMVRLGKTYKNFMIDMRPTNEKLIERAKHMIAAVCQCSQEHASDVFEKAHSNVKVAIVMEKRGCDYETALDLLGKSKGNIDEALILE